MPYSTSEELQLRIKRLEEEIAEHKLSEKKISALSSLCSLLGTDHQNNINIIIGRACEILSSACALYRRFDGNGNIRNTWAGCGWYEEVSEQTLIDKLDRNITRQDLNFPCVIIEDLCIRSHSNVNVAHERGAATGGLLSCLGVAVVLKKEIIGSLSLFDTESRQYSTTDKRVLPTLAKAVAIEEERYLAKREIQESEERYRTILEDIEEGYYEVDLKGNFLFLGGAFCEIFGYEEQEILGRNYVEFSTPETAGRAFAVFNTVFTTERPAKGISWEIPGKNGVVKYLESSISLIKSQDGPPVGFRGIVRDVTERRHLEFQLRQAQKMEAIGTLSGGIAHDFNNILSIIVGNTEVALSAVDDWKLIQENLNEIRLATMRARDVIRQMQIFCRNQEVARSVVHLGPIIKESLKLLRASIPKSIEIKLGSDCRRDTVVADVTQINQILINLCTNAAHAMQSSGGGILELSLTNVTLTESDNSVLPQGLYAALQVKDTGVGIGAEIIGRIFDPYFTTKPVGKGTGMGLAMVHGIVHAHGGDITVESVPGKGTAFTVFLPVTEDRPTRIQTDTVTKLTGNERILVVDDETTLAHTTKKNLERLGYQVTVATSPEDGLSLFIEAPDQFDMVITDMIMPGMTGDRLAETLMKIKPELPVVLCTGHCGTITESQVKQKGIRELMIKPVMLENLALTIRRILDQ